IYNDEWFDDMPGVTTCATIKPEDSALSQNVGFMGTGEAWDIGCLYNDIDDWMNHPEGEAKVSHDLAGGSTPDLRAEEVKPTLDFFKNLLKSE
ncbi:MAG: hypothetical protein Q9164_007480, partial [Protoblastenia rupestris]